jgi:hypothetical protein
MAKGGGCREREEDMKIHAKLLYSSITVSLIYKKECIVILLVRRGVYRGFSGGGLQNKGG